MSNQPTHVYADALFKASHGIEMGEGEWTKVSNQHRKDGKGSPKQQSSPYRHADLNLYSVEEFPPLETNGSPPTMYMTRAPKPVGRNYIPNTKYLSDPPGKKSDWNNDQNIKASKHNTKARISSRKHDHATYQDDSDSLDESSV
jgi:hypothetical protein